MRQLESLVRLSQVQELSAYSPKYVICVMRIMRVVLWHFFLVRGWLLSLSCADLVCFFTAFFFPVVLRFCVEDPRLLAAVALYSTQQGMRSLDRREDFQRTVLCFVFVRPKQSNVASHIGGVCTLLFTTICHSITVFSCGVPTPGHFVQMGFSPLLLLALLVSLPMVDGLSRRGFSRLTSHPSRIFLLALLWGAGAREGGAEGARD